MSDSVIDQCPGAWVASNGATQASDARVVAAHRGAGMLEFLVALLIFSVGMIGLLSAQLIGKKASFDASQRSIATALARDIVERMRANPGQTAAYQVAGAGDEARRLPRPDADCDTADCSAWQLAVFDLWQWESLLVGESAQDSVGNAGGLIAPRACINSVGGEVDVTISWRGVTRGVMTVEPIAPAACGEGVESVESVESVEEMSPQESGNGLQRHQLTVSTFIARR